MEMTFGQCNGKHIMYIIVRGHVYSRGIFLKKVNHYNNFDCYTLGNAKPVVGTSENVAEPDYDVMKMAAILNLIKSMLLHNIHNSGSISIF